jgi:uncharacterized protein (TIGR04255 family)
MGTKLKNAPVYFTLAQVRFNPILSLETYINGLQESLRKEGFPDFKKNMLATFNVVAAAAAGQMATPQLSAPQSEAQYVFTNIDGTTGFVLGQNYLSFQATEYDVFETFSASLLKVLELLHRAVGLSYFERIGVRYLDLVFPRAGEELGLYVLPEVMGLSGKASGTLIYSFSETRAQTKTGSIVARVIIQDGGVGFPPDLNPLGMQVAERFRKLQGRHATLDTDAFSETREPFDLANVQQRLNDLHTEVVTVFRGTVTPHALDVWK